MKVVLDTNVVLVPIGKRSPCKPIGDAFINGKYQLVVADEIVYEYEEILRRYSAPGAAELVLEILIESPDVIFKQVYYLWHAIQHDPDDNKFFDLAVAANADYLVTNDSHFNEALKSPFPKINIISADEFLEIVFENEIAKS